MVARMPDVPNLWRIAIAISASNSPDRVVFARQHQLDKAFGVAFGLGPIYVRPGDTHHAHRAIFCVSLSFGQSEMCGFRVGKGCPRQSAILRFLRHRCQDVAYCHPAWYPATCVKMNLPVTSPMP